MLNLNIPENLKEYSVFETGVESAKNYFKYMGYKPGDYIWFKGIYKEGYLGKVLENYEIRLVKMEVDETLPNSTRFPTADVEQEGLKFLRKQSLKGNIFYLPQRFNNLSITKHGFKGYIDLVLESDTLTTQEQINNIAVIGERTGFYPNTIIHTGNKSLHAHYRFLEFNDEQSYKRLFLMLKVLFECDTAMDKQTQPCRLVGMQRLKDNNIKEVSLIYGREGEVNFYEFYNAIESIWLENGYKILDDGQLSKKRLKIYNESNTAIDNNSLEHPLFENPKEAFILDEEEFSKRFKYKSESSGDNEYKGFGKSPNMRILEEVVKPILENMYLEDQFSGYPKSSFVPVFKNQNQSTSPWSKTNSSGTTLSVKETDRGLSWYCQSSHKGAVSSTHFLGHLWYGEYPKGSQFKDFIQNLCVKVGVDYETEYEKYKTVSNLYPSDKAVKKSLEEVYEENVLDSYDFLSLDVSEVSKKTSAIRTPKTTLGMVLKNPEYATSLQEVFQSDFINIKTPNVAVVKELQERGITDVRVYVQPGDIQKSSMMMGYHQLAELLKDFNIKFEWHGQSEECHKFAHEIDTKLKFITFTHLCDKAAYLSNKKGRVEAFNKISGCSDENVTEFCERYVSDAGIVMEAGKITLIDSPMGSGKTHFLGLQVDEFLEENPEKAVISIGHRNGLQRAISRKCTLQMFIEDRGLNTNKLALAVDSVRHIPLNLFKGSFIILDEFEAMIQHAITSSTISKRRKSCITRLKEGLQLCLASGGKVYASEANISNATFDFLKTIGIERSQINFYKNTRKASERVILINAGNSDTATISDLLECVKSGKKILFATDSASKSEIVYEKLKKDNPDVKVILINKYTANDDLVKEFLENPDETIAREQPDCVIYSPTLDSGGDISKPYFDEVYGLFNTLETRVQLQMLFRCRVDIPIHIHVKETAKNDRDSNYTGFDVEELKTLHKKGTEVFNKKSNSSNFYEGWLEEDDSLYELISRVNDDSTLEAKLLELFCKFEVRSNLAKADMRDNLISALSKTHFVEVQELGVVEGVKEELDIIKEEILEKRSEEFANADTSNMSVAAAEKILDSNSAKTEDVVKAEKKIFEENYPDIELSKGFAKKMLIKNNGEGRKKANELAIVMYPEMAKAKEKSSWESQKKSEMILLWDVKLVYQKSMLVNSLNFLETVYKACDEGTFHKNNPDLINLAQEMAYKSKEFKRLYKVTINPKLSPVKVISGFCKKLGIKLEVVKRGVESDGSRTYIYNIVKDEDYDFTMQMVAAIKKNFDEKGVKEEVVRERSETFITPEFDIADIESSDSDDFDFLDVAEQEIVKEIWESNFEKNPAISLDFYKSAFKFGNETVKSNKELANLYG